MADEPLYRHVYLPMDVIFKIKEYSLKRSKKDKVRYTLRDFYLGAIKHLSSTKINKYATSYNLTKEDVSDVIIKLTDDGIDLFYKAFEKAQREAGTDMTERRMLTTAILQYLNHELNFKDAKFKVEMV